MRAARAFGGYSGFVCVTIEAAVILAGTFMGAAGIFDDADESTPDSLLFPFLAACVFWPGEVPTPNGAPADGWPCDSLDAGSTGATGAGPTENLHAALP